MDFDRQAETFDRRAGLPDEATGAIAGALFKIAGANRGLRLLEVGAGTGQIGLALCAQGFDYCGFDHSAGMLEAFRSRLAGADPDRTELHEADGNARWPAADGSVHVVFSSRTLHLLDRYHVADEIFRVAHGTGAWAITGTVVRDQSGVSARMRRRMRELLRERGIEGRSGERNRRQLFAHCCARGAELLDPVSPARWTAVQTPARSLTGWRNKPGLAGCDVSTEIKDAVLRDLELWAHDQFGDLSTPREFTETYSLEGIHIPKSS